MRILHWTESFHPRIGGMEVFVRHLVEHQISQGHRCQIITGALPDQSEFDDSLGYTITRLHFQRSLIARSLVGIMKIQQKVDTLVADFSPDLLHLHTSQASAFFYTRARNLPKALYTAHDGLLETIHTSSSLLEKILSSVVSVVAPSDFVATKLRQLFPTAEQKIERVYGSLPCAIFADRQTDFPSTPYHLLAMGRLIPEKGFDVFLRAVARVHKSFPNMKVTISGDGPEADSLRGLAATLALDNTVHFTGWTQPEAISDLIAAAAIVVGPSLWQEPFGLVALQAMQQGRPVIASRVGGLQDIVEERTGYLVPPGDDDALADAIIALLNSPEQLSTWGRNAALLAATKFAWSDCVDAYQRLYEDMTR